MLDLFEVDMVKQWRRPRTYVALGVALLVPVVMAVALKTNPPGAPGTGASGGFGPGGGNDPVSFLATKTGLIVPVFALELTDGFLLVVLAALFGGDAIAAEANWGSLRALLARPVGRGHLLAAKLASALLLTLLVTVTVVIAGLIAGGIAFGWHALDAPLLGLHQSVTEMIGNLVLATGYVAWGLAGVVALGFMVSTMVDTPAGAIFAAVGFYLVTRILDNITALGSIRNALPTHYADAWTGLFTNSSSTSDMIHGIVLQVPYILGFCGVAWWWFHHKDVLS
jgi:ABC-2 type transport system permease protein